ncbi:Hsp20/alpha crystallin family protein [Verrucomicrobiota bacterium sgz303538]
MSQSSSQTETRPAQTADSRVSYLTPLANIVETQDGYILEAEMPGVNKEGLEITVDNGELLILGHRQRAPKPGQPLYRESRDLDFRRVFELDPSIDASKISAKIDQGVLKLTLPKAESVKPRKITVGE